MRRGGEDEALSLGGAAKNCPVPHFRVQSGQACAHPEVFRELRAWPQIWMAGRAE